MKRIGLLSVLGAAAALAGCALPAEVADVNRVLAAKASGGTAFTQALFQEYQAFTRQEAQVDNEWVDAAKIAQKALRAANGENVAPDEIASRKVPTSRAPELAAARERLMGYFSAGATERVPAAAAKAQVAFDCWLEHTAEGRAESPCKATFLGHEPMLKKPVAVAENAPEAKVVSRYTVTFPTGSSQLSAQAVQTLKDAAMAAMQAQAGRVVVSGYTDTVGGADTNLALSRHRADAVTKQLVSLGVAPGVIAEDAQGETRLAVSTPDKTAEAKNRRVEVALEQTAGWRGNHGWGWGNGFGYNYAAYGNQGWGGWGHGGYGWGGGGHAVFFASGSSALSAESVERLKQVVAAQKEMKPKAVRVVGFADGTGSPATNARISRQRAEAVAAQLTKLGGSATTVDAQGYGSGWGWGRDGSGRRVEIFFDFQ